MKKYKFTKILRTIVQILFFIFLPGLVGMAFLEIKALFLDLFNANFISILSDCSLIIILAISTILLGRFFCGWMCMFGTYNDIINLIGKKIFKINYQPNKTIDKILKYFKYVILLFFAGLVWTSIVKLPTDYSPWDALMQLSNPLDAIKNYYIGLIILALITIGDLFIERFFCRYFCPLGAVFSILSKLRILNIKKDKTICGPCKACTYKCSMGIDLDAVNLVKSGECINCLNCTSICPKRNAKLSINNKVVNEYAIATLAVAGTTGLYLGAEKIVPNLISETTTTENNSLLYNDGTYIGTGTGYRSNLKVSVTIKNGKIESINLISTNDTAEFFNKAWSSLKNKIISSQSADVDTISGATFSSNGIIEAVNNALLEARKDQNTSTNSETSTTEVTSTTTTTTTTTTKGTINQTYKDGTYTGSGRGKRGNITVSVVISNDKITSINLISDNDDANWFNQAWSEIPNDIISKQSTNVNVVSGATLSSNGIINAVNDALSQAKY